MTRSIVDIHILQTLPPSNVNRDDTGSPKSAVYGGVRRARVSSQAWKRAARTKFSELLDPADRGMRTKRVVELVADEIVAQSDGAIEVEAAQEAAKHALDKAGIKLKAPRRGSIDEATYLIFVSTWQARALAELAREAIDAGGLESIDKARAKQILREDHSIDIALFGRMVADVTDLNVDASAQVAHALSVHAVENEYDYFTAIDDLKAASEDEDAGAGMIGTVEFNSSTLYRYATVDVDRLRDNLGDDEATLRALEAFITAFATSMPTGKQNTFANRTLPSLVSVHVRDDQPISLVGAFEQPVPLEGGGSIVARAGERLDAYAQQVFDAYGNAPAKAWQVSVGLEAGSAQTLGEPVGWSALRAGVVDYLRDLAAS